MNAAAFHWGDGDLNITHATVYPHKMPFFKLRGNDYALGFSMAFSRDELRYLLPIPQFVSSHDAYIQFSAIWRNKLSFVDTPCAVHRFTGKHNVSAFRDNNVMPPFLVRQAVRIRTYMSVIWRSLVR